LDRLARELRDAAERGQQGRDGEARARRLRAQAERLLADASPEDRERLERLARDAAGPRGPIVPPTDRTPLGDVPTTPVDARPSDPAASPKDRVIAEWLSDRAPDRGGPVTREAVAEGVRDAARGAERAIEQQAVPQRYGDLVRRVFRRYVDRAAPAGPVTPP